ncbi:hypothetical protein DPMN_075072 [Dreissena polymorpha]|uniref:Uncharacterized protein n=1 Tax=Dreissena polymorpha TaxID=45954 RepID=A0A9D3YJT8_DREPO|nr:hypothetical protein DPMN_075072 [Dreissena polymorpha]
MVLSLKLYCVLTKGTYSTTGHIYSRQFSILYQADFYFAHSAVLTGEYTSKSTHGPTVASNFAIPDKNNIINLHRVLLFCPLTAWLQRLQVLLSPTQPKLIS